MVVEELETDLLAQHIVSRDLDSQHFVSGRSLCDTFLHLAQQHLDILVGQINLQFEIIAHFRLAAVLLLGDEAEVLDRIAATDNELGGMPFGQLDGGDIEREVTLLAVLRLDAERVLHRHVEADKRRERLGEGHVADVVSRGWTRCVGRHIAHEAVHLVVAVGPHPGGVGAIRADRILASIGMGEGDGFEMVFHPWYLTQPVEGDGPVRQYLEDPQEGVEVHA